MKQEFIYLAVTAMLAAAHPAIAAAPPVTAPAAASTVAAPARPSVKDTVLTLNDVCLPILRGAAVKPTAEAAGFRARNGEWVLTIAGKRQITLDPPDVANPRLCTVTIDASPGGVAMRAALAAWAAGQSPALTPVKVDDSVAGVTHERATSSWSAQTPSGVEGVVLSQEKTLQGQPTDGGLDESTLYVSLTPA